MSTDRELLELAAKAAGFECRYINELLGCEVWNADMEQSEFWNPLDNDGDCFRLAVTLKRDVRFPQDNDMYVDAGDCDAFTVYLIDAGNDRAAATRRAIVRAAAAIGKEMP